jgi:hypothetical protein
MAMAGVVRPVRLVLVLLGAVAFVVLLLLLTSGAADAAEPTGDPLSLPGSATGVVTEATQSLDTALDPAVSASEELAGIDAPTLPGVEPLLDAPALEPLGDPPLVDPPPVIDTVTEAVRPLGLDGPLVGAVGDIVNDAGALLPPPPDVVLPPVVPLPPVVAVPGEPTETGGPNTVPSADGFASIGRGPGPPGDTLSPVGPRESTAGAILSAALTTRLRLQPLPRGDVTPSIGGKRNPFRGGSPGDSPASELRAPPWAPSSTIERRLAGELFAVVVLAFAFLLLMGWNRVRSYPLVHLSWVGLTSARPG